MNKKGLDETQLKYLAVAEELQKELIGLGFMATRIEKQKNDRCTFNVIFFDGVHDYRIHKDFNGNVHVTRLDYKHYENVTHYTRMDVYKKYIAPLGNMKVITTKKLQARIDAENAYHVDMEELNNKAARAVELFLARIEDLAGGGVSVRYAKDYEGKKITGGWVVRNGVELHFEIAQDGYISKKLTVQTDYREEGRDYIADFLALSDNKYRA